MFWVWYCWVILRFVIGIFLFPIHLLSSVCLLFFAFFAFFKPQRNYGRKAKRSDTFKLNFYFRGLRLFCRVQCFPEPVEPYFPIKVFEESHKSFLVNYEFEGPSYMSVFSRYVQITLLLASDTTRCGCLRPSQTCELRLTVERKRCFRSVLVRQGIEKSFFLTPENPSF